jgi:ABC-type dipeptide/oligopeptide/nickel transport system permease component
VLLGVVTITFILVSAIPLQERLLACIPPTHNPPPPNSPAYNRELALCGLNQPIWEQYGTYIYNTFTFHLGYIQNSTEDGLWRSANQIHPCLQLNISKAEGGCEVATVMESWLPYTIELAGLSLIFILLLAIPLGNASAVNRNRPIDQSTRVLSFSGYAMPGYLLGSLLLLAAYFVLAAVNPTGGCANTPYAEVYGSWNGAMGQLSSCYTPGGIGQPLWQGRPPFANALWGTSPTGFPTVDGILWASSHSAPPGLPGGKYYYWDLVGDHVLRMMIPALTIAYGAVAGLLRYVRNSMLEVMNLDFVRTARAKGVPERQVVKRHAGRNSLNVTVTVLGLTFAAFLGGFAITESLFGQYGVGMLFAYSVLEVPDVGTVFGTTVIFTIIIVVANLLVDVVYGLLDPRVRLG